MKTSISRSATVVVLLSGFALTAAAGSSPQFWTTPRPTTAPAKKLAAKPAPASPPSGTSSQPCNHACAGCGKG